MIETLREILSEPVSGEPLGLFRLLFGALCAAHFFSPLQRAKVVQFFKLNHYFAPYAAFRWMPIANGRLVRLLVILRSLAFLTLAVGAFPQISALICLAIAFYFFVADQTRYCNFEYLCLVFLTLFVVVDSAASYSPFSTPRTIPYWHLLLFQLQFLFIYTYAGLAKLNSKWLLEGMPLRFQFSEFSGNTGRPIRYHRYCGTERVAAAIKKMLDRTSTAIIFSWGGVLLDLLIVPLLWYPVTRPYAIVPFLLFHLFNSWFLAIGAFAWVNLAAIVLFISYGGGQ